MTSRVVLTFVVLSLLFLSSFVSAPSLAVESVSAPQLNGALQLDPPSPRQGQPLVVEVSMAGTERVAPITFNKKKYCLLPISRSESGETLYRAIIGVPADLPPGPYDIAFGDTHKLKVLVQSGKFGVQKIRLPRSKDNFISSPGEEETVQRAKDTVSLKQFWTGKFRAPSKARTSSAFGLRRMVNGRLLKDYFHSGLDYAGGLGSPVYATQAGRVIIAKTGWRLHGNTIAIDHGHGVISFYIHLSKILVKPGQMVAAGEQIGKIGATGRASGPHLHFSIYANGNATNPHDWYSRDI